MEPDEQLQIVDGWTVVDRWWTDCPKRIHWVVIEAPGGDRIAVSYEVGAERPWTFKAPDA